MKGVPAILSSLSEQFLANLRLKDHLLHRGVLTFVCAWSACISVHGQTIEEKFKNYRLQTVQEKLYVHTDRDLYLTGESLWLKVYAVDGSFHRPFDLSKVAYVELMSETGESTVQAKINLTNGRGSGTLFLPATMSSGKYLLRAYTRWMKNFDTEFYFQKTISIVNTFIRLDAPEVAAAGIEANFFPEGGNWVAGLEGKIAFKVTDKKGTGVSFRGSLIDERNDTLLHFQPLRFGMGSFVFTPRASAKYRAVISVNRQRKTFDLPEVQTSGYSMRVVEEQGRVRVQVSSTETLSANVFLFAHARQVIARSLQSQATNGIASFELGVNDFPDGISHITIFNASQQPVCERLYFRRPTNPMQLTASTDKKEYGLRKPVTLNIKSTDPSNLSVSVYRLDSLSTIPGNGILEYLWLSSDLKGFIESPEFYFEDSDLSRTAGDNLMLTQGWRRFKWTEVLNGKPVVQFAPEHQDHLIEGVAKTKSGKVTPGVLTYLSSPDKIINTYSARSDSGGLVLYSVRNLYGPRKIITHCDSIFHVELLSPFSQIAPSRHWSSLSLGQGTQPDLLARSIWMQAQDIYYDEKIKPVRFDSISFYGRADGRYLLDDYTRFPVMEEILREYVPGVMVRKHQDNYELVLRNEVTNKLISSTPTVLIDGVPIFDINKIISFDPLRVSKLEVMNRNYYNGNSIFYGLVSFTTYTGDLAGFPLDEHYTTINYDALNLAREFFSPDYGKETNAFLPDQRSLLFWSPDVTGSTDGTVLKFHTSDLEGRYGVVVEGLADKGKAGRATYEFTVLK